MADAGNLFYAETANNLSPTLRLTSGIFELDERLGGGLPTRGVLEICGESGSGKTQLCLQLCLTVQYPVELGGLGGAVAYICTEDSFPSKRLQQLMSLVPLPKGLHAKELSNSIFIEHVPDFETLKECLTKRLTALVAKRNVKLLIIDSVAALFRGAYSKGDGLARTQHLRALGAILHKLNSFNNVCVICVNQVTSEISRGGSTVAALGLAWGNMVTTRLQMSKLQGRARLMQVVFSPVIPELNQILYITENGVKSVA